MIVSQLPKKYQHRKETKKMKKQKNYRKVAAVGRYFAMAFAVVLLCMVSQSISTIHADAKVTFDITADGVLKGIDGTAAVIKVRKRKVQFLRARMKTVQTTKINK